MIPLKQIGASLPPGSENRGLILMQYFQRNCVMQKFMIMVQQLHRQTERQTDDLTWHNCALPSIAR